VLPHFWETWWFDVSADGHNCAAIIGAVRFAVTRNLRIKTGPVETTARQSNANANAIARIFIDDLARADSILLQSAWPGASLKNKSRRTLCKFPARPSNSSARWMKSSGPINPENDNLDGLVTYVGKYVQEFVTLAGLRCRLDLPAQLSGIGLSAKCATNLFLAVKEAFEQRHQTRAGIRDIFSVENAAVWFQLCHPG